MKILYVITGLSVGGAEKVVINLADTLAARGCKVVVAYLTGKAEMLPSNLDVKVVCLRLNNALDIIPVLFRLRNLIVKFSPDVVHSHSFHANIIARLCRVAVPMKKLISSAHSTNEGGWYRMLLYRVTDGLADFTTNVSQAAVRAFESKRASGLGRIIEVRNGVDTSVFRYSTKARVEIRRRLGISDGHNLLLAVGRLTEAKDYPTLFRALVKLNSKRSDYNLCVVGAGPLEVDLRHLVVELGIADHVRFLGLSQDVAGLMSAADIFVLSSAWEGFGLVVAEAMACERVVVATDAGGVREVIGEAGFLVRPSQPAELSEALFAALSLSQEERAALGERARQRVIKYYSFSHVVDVWLQLYANGLCRMREGSDPIR